MKSKYTWTVFRSPFIVKTMNGFNLAMILKAFDTMIKQKKIKELGDREYNLVKFIVKDGLNIAYSEIYKTSFNFSGLIIKDISKIERVNVCFSILDAFLQCGPIQKSIFDEWYDPLSNVFTEVFGNSELELCKETIKEYVNRWINDLKISQIVRDDIKKLSEIFPKEEEPIQ